MKFQNAKSGNFPDGHGKIDWKIHEKLKKHRNPQYREKGEQFFSSIIYHPSQSRFIIIKTIRHKYAFIAFKSFIIYFLIF